MDMAYTSARIRGFRARLLRKDDYHSLVEARGVEECFELLRAGYYGADMDRASVRFKDTYQMIDHALTENLNSQIASIWKMVPEKLHPHLKAFLYPWDGYNVKATIRVVTKGGNRQRLVDSLLPTGRLTTGQLKALAASHSLDEVVTHLSLWREPLAGVLKRALKTYRVHKSILPIEVAIDRYVLTGPLRMLTRRDRNTTITRRVLSERIDALNILTLVKIHREGYKEAESFFIEGGRLIKRKGFRRLAGIEDREELFRELSDSIGESGLKELFSPLHVEQPWILEERLEDHITRIVGRDAVEEPLTIAILFEYIYKKIREVKNIRLILRGKVTGMPDSRIREAFIEPWRA